MEKTVKLLIILFLFFILPKYLFSETQDILEIDIYPKTSITSYKPIPLSNVLPSVTIINNDTIEKIRFTAKESFLLLSVSLADTNKNKNQMIN